MQNQTRNLVIVALLAALVVVACWKQSPGQGEHTKAGSAKSYYDFTDPQDSGRRLRVNVEAAGSTPKAFMQVVANILSKDGRKCPTPYATTSRYLKATPTCRI